ncbi:hypothetical protein F1C58_16810 (plasmid) [Glaciihabitans sp. INWT7]|uniref:hypothetical protein n=1 Tax=Glaciihabitans sp. INWT7 TaxID=2596912 RepID=UPI00162346E3|nr:hypothetical protein [Glaciihabitans sp. INWT7]QNE48719.1 hypothetical protein F1C58_16810 [Glaciihabitans sp. INWT7]
MTETTAGGALDEVMAASRPVIYPTEPTRRADMLNDRAYDLASDPKPQPRPPLTVAQLRLLGTGVALVSVYIGWDCPEFS